MNGSGNVEIYSSDEIEYKMDRVMLPFSGGIEVPPVRG